MHKRHPKSLRQMSYYGNPSRRVPGRKILANMYVKKSLVIVWLMVAAGLPAYGNSGASVSQDLLTSPENIVIDSQPAVTCEECLLFRSTLQNAPRNGMESPMSYSQGPRPTEMHTVQDRITSLPEPGTGILLSIGLLGLIHLGRTKMLLHEG